MLPRRPAPARALGVAALTLVVVLAGCQAVPSGVPAEDAGGAAEDAAEADDGIGDDPDDPSAAVEIVDDRLELVTGNERMPLATVDDGRIVHAQLRPAGAEGTTTVLAVVRTEDRYEMRYLDVVDGEASDLYWFPHRMQIDPDSARVVDVPPVPVWAPDGSAIAWLEWNEAGTRLRTVGWLDHAGGTNPSDAQATYDVADVPTGSQLTRWETGEDGVPVLLTGDEAQRWRIRIEDGEPVVALDAAV